MTILRVSDLVPAGETIRYTAGWNDAFNGGFKAIVLKDGKILSQDSDVAEGFQRVSVELAHSLLGRSLKTNFTSFRASLKNWFYGDTPLVDLYDEMVEDLRAAA